MNINLTLLGQLIAFGMFAVICMRWIWPPLQAVLEERRQRIAKGLDDAKQAAEDRSRATDEAAQQLAQARSEASELTQAARQSADATLEKARREADDLLENARQRAEEEVGRQVVSASRELQAQMAQLVTAAAGKALADTLDEPERRKIVGNLADKL